MSTGTILTKIPWFKVVKFGPIIVDMAGRIFDKIKEALTKQGQPTAKATGESISVSSLDERLTRLETNELQQAELVANIASQVSELTSILQIVSKRTLVSLILAGVAFLASLVSIILTLTK